MKSIIVGLAASVITLAAQPAASWNDYSLSMIAYPVRMQGTNRVNLGPLFQCIRLMDDSHLLATETSGRRPPLRNPMPQWRPLKMRVSQVKEWGIIGVPFRVSVSAPFGFNQYEIIYEDAPVILKNYPTKGLAEGSKITLVALRSGTEKHEDIDGAERTLRVYDGGLPFASKERKEQSGDDSKPDA